MNKLWLIIQREYLVRVRKKSFILITLLTPLLFALFMILPTLLVVLSGPEQVRILVRDDAGVLNRPLKQTERADFTISTEPLDALKERYREMGYDGVLYLPPFSPDMKELRLKYYSDKQLSLGTQAFIESQIEKRLRAYKILAAGLSEELLASLETDVELEQKELTLDESGRLTEVDKATSAGLATALGFFSAFVIYFILIFYGAMVMRSVMEEKTSRIVEIIISSVRPFQLMMGKIVGVSAVGLTQLLIWIILIPTLMAIAGLFLPQPDPQMMQGGMMMQQSQSDMQQALEIMDSIMNQNWGLILPLFVLYFLGGYLIYSSLFAAVGSAIGDDLGESQSLTFPVMLPIILAILFLTAIIEDPNGPLAFWTSMIPFFSPIIMVARIPFEPPAWQIVLSLALLLGSALFFVWLSGRIYRVGILMYGKKATFKELKKWLFYKE